MNLSGHHKKTLEKIFGHPVSHNIEWHDVLSLLEYVGTVEQQHDGRFKVTVGARTVVFDSPRPRHADVLDDGQVVDLRKLLADAGMNPE